MMHSSEVLIRAGELAAAGEPFALATVTRVVRPASTRQGDRALVTQEGELVGWIGGACSEPAVIGEALRALEDGEPRLVLIRKPGRTDAVPDDTIVVESSCASEGEVEVLIEPELPALLLAVIGESPTAATLADLAQRVGWRVETEITPQAAAIVIASMGRVDATAIRTALTTNAGYIGLVASTRRGAAAVERLRLDGVDEHSIARVRCPAGLDLGPSSQEEIAVAVLAELVAWKHGRRVAGTSIDEMVDALDPVCGMSVAANAAAERSFYGEITYYFCCTDCRVRFEEDPLHYVAQVRA